jgi:hypothetical protein
MVSYRAWAESTKGLSAAFPREAMSRSREMALISGTRWPITAPASTSIIDPVGNSYAFRYMLIEVNPLSLRRSMLAWLGSRDSVIGVCLLSLLL